MIWEPSGQRTSGPVRAHFEATYDLDAFTASDVDPPLKAGEKAWAQIDAGRLVVSRFSVGDDDKDHLARYELSVSDGWMAFKYTLLHGAEIVESVTGRLFRAKIVM